MNDKAHESHRRSTRASRKFDPNHMPSGTLEMERLRKQIGEDSSESECESPSASTEEPEGPADQGLCMALTSNDVNLPTSWRQAILTPKWEDAMAKEVDELRKKDAWELVPRPANVKVLPGVWSFRIKRDENGDVTKYKARWCVDGSREGFLRPPENTFSPVAELPTIRAMIAIAAKNGQVILQADFPNAYVNAEIKEDVYVHQPKGLEEKDSDNHVCKLKKALYGCPISGKRWNETLETAILSLGYSQSKIDHCFFYREENGIRDLLLIYVDDLLVTSSAGTDRAELMLDELSKIFEIKKLGKARHILGLGIHQGDDGIFLEQSAYITSILEEAGYSNAKMRNTPWDTHLKESAEKLCHDEVKVFRRILGQLSYLANGTRPDLAWAVNRTASGMAAPTKGKWERIKRLLRYLNGTKNLGLWYRPRSEGAKVETYVDSSFAADNNKGKSITGYIVYVNGGPIAWKSHLQDTVADSPNASEYIALYEAAKESVSLHNLLNKAGLKLEGTCLVHEDNDGSRRLAMCGMGQKKARHLDTKYHYVQELCKLGKVKVARVATKDQPADLLTKGSHTGKTHEHLLKKLGVVNQA